jgi:predicted GIY-YIG superfamily endonuclease
LFAGADILGAAVPVVPSVGTFRHGARLLGKADDVVDLVKGVGKTVNVAEEAASGTTTVYRSINAAGKVQYVGITNDLARRAAEHLTEKGIRIQKLMGGLSRSDARAVEQALIEIHDLQKQGGTLINKINSISKKNPEYAKQLQRGLELLQEVGYDALK